VFFINNGKVFFQVRTLTQTQGYKTQVVQLTVDWEAWIMLMDPYPTVISAHLLPPCKHVTCEMTVQEDVDEDEEGAVLVELVTHM
jgi:hypothetical protein